MPAWQVRRYRRTAVYWEGLRWVVVAHEAERGGRHRYELRRWPEEDREEPGAVVRYDEACVEERERLRRLRRRSGLTAFVAKPLLPLIGFLPARTKLALSPWTGVHPVRAARASLFVEFLLLVLSGASQVIHVGTAGALTPEFRWLVPAMLVLGIDAAVRYGPASENGMHQPGFLEWIFRRTPKPAPRAARTAELPRVADPERDGEASREA